jgi:DNA phosphorothioation system restriction enzyme
MAPLSKPDWLEPREYQDEAVQAWMSNSGQGILNMATGTGKTITSLLAASQLTSLQDDSLALIIAAPYQHLVDQWKSDLTDFGASPVLAYQSRTRWTDMLASQVTEYNSGVRSILAVITTHRTFSSDHFQNLVGRLNGARTMLIVDEVHHVGAPHLRSSLPQAIRARLGLSATPQRWHDEEGTEALTNYFSNGVVFEYGLEEAIENGYLAEYYYVPHIIELTEDEQEEYLALSRSIGKQMAAVSGDVGDADSQANETLKQLLFKRARLIGSAVNKIPKLRDLLTEAGIEDLHHTLVYSGDGTVGDESEKTRRQLEAITELMGNELGLRIHQFTYEEDQAERERLLDEFETGVLQALVAIRCLDEGVDVPATRTAFILASSSNPRQFIQRRGRILRTHPNKDHATIHDFVVAPPTEIREAGEDSLFSLERNLVQKELQRVSTFAESARNHPDASIPGIPTSTGSIRQLKKDFNLLDV